MNSSYQNFLVPRECDSMIIIKHVSSLWGSRLPLISLNGTEMNAVEMLHERTYPQILVIKYPVHEYICFDFYFAPTP